MSARRFPFVTLGLLLVMSGLYLLVREQANLYFSATDIARGEAWRLVTGHLAHADLQHLFWNGLGLGVLGWMIERHSVALLWVSLGVGIGSVDILLLSPFSQLHYYCGLSGVLNTLLVVALWLEWDASRSVLVGAVALSCVLKVAIESSLGVAILTDISWPPYSWAHVAGLLGGLIVVFGEYRQSLPNGPLSACGRCLFPSTASKKTFLRVAGPILGALRPYPQAYQQRSPITAGAKGGKITKLKGEQPWKSHSNNASPKPGLPYRR